MNDVLLIENCDDTYKTVLNSVRTIAQISRTQTISEAKNELRHKDFKLIILETELPDGDGIEFCSEIQRSHAHIPIIFLTANTKLADKVLSFSAGADDYITKPFHPLELRARLETRLRKNKQLSIEADKFNWKELQIVKSRQEVMIQDQMAKSKIELTSLEYKLLIYFAYRTGEVIHRDQILTDIWGADIYVSHRSVDTHVSKIRKKLGPVSHILESIHGSGYKFNPTVDSSMQEHI